MNVCLSDLMSLEDWKPKMTKLVLESVEKQDMSLKEFLGWRVEVWKDICRECSGLDISRLEEYLEDSEYLQSLVSDVSPVKVSEVRRFIKKRIQELKDLEKVTPYEEIWEFTGNVDAFGHVLTRR